MKLLIVIHVGNLLTFRTACIRLVCKVIILIWVFKFVFVLPWFQAFVELNL